MANAYTSRRSVGRRPAAPARKMGTWKLAYADFLTALCAFFLVMWIVHGVSAEDKVQIAEAFGGEAQAQEFAAIDDPQMEVQTVARLLRENAGLLAYGSSVTITTEPYQVRIELTDMATRPLFEMGDGALNETGEALANAAGQAISILDFPVLIEGHTDSNPSLTVGYSNWELSADRANSARRILEASGVSARRIKAVTGLADTQPLLQDEPGLPANRRISIVLVIKEKVA